MKRLLFLVFAVLLPFCAGAKTITGGFKAFSDSLNLDVRNHFSCKGYLKILKVESTDKSLDFFFNNSLADFPFREKDLSWLKGTMEKRLPKAYSKHKVRNIYTDGINLEEYLKPITVEDPGKAFRFIEEKGQRRFMKGLDRRYIALWQSHGKYFEASEGRWIWQRPAMNTTIEDIYTQSYVIPFLIPMLENAGAYVVTPRERDLNSYETIADNDHSFLKERNNDGVRRQGRYTETGRWSDCGTGFADTSAVISGDANPFKAGTARKSKCIKKRKTSASAIWEFDFPKKGHYAVYISYKTLENSSTCAHYCVHHAAGTSEFLVNQKMGGGTWVYLGSFDFEGKGSVSLDNGSSSEREFVPGSVVTADAVRIGGGMGKVARRGECSGIPSYLEGAMYNLQWSGFDKSIWGNESSEYVNEYSCRPYWVRTLKDDYGIPVDLAVAFHSDGGVVSPKKTIGTLAIYTLPKGNSSKFSSGMDRMASRELCLKIQDEIVDGIRRDWTSDWSRRGAMNRPYRESNQCDVPSMILELLSHHNFDDMKYGLDPEFRFDVSRAIYKGVLKYIAGLYGCSYVVQPLPVQNFSALWDDKGKLKLRWDPTPDPMEPTATPKGYILYTRVDDGCFDKGREISGSSTVVDVAPGHVYSFKIEAWNEGGKSFPSEILAAGKPLKESGERVIVVNNFTRVSGPTWFDDEDYSGFDVNKDGGVPYLYDISFAGAVYDFKHSNKWISNELPGYSASYFDYDTSIIAGNSFDYVAQHGKALMELGRAFCSSSVAAFKGNEAKILDLICGKQLSSLPQRNGAVRHKVYSPQLMAALDTFTEAGGNVIISGARIATDAVSEIYPGAAEENLSKYLQKRFGFALVSSVAGRNGKVGNYEFYTTPNEQCYFVENADAIRSAGGHGKIIMRYQQGNLPAAVYYNAENYKSVAFGFPLETVKNASGLKELLGFALNYL